MLINMTDNPHSNAPRGVGNGGAYAPIPFHIATFNSKCISHRIFSKVLLELPQGIKSM